LICQLANAVNYMHEKGVMHRNLNPMNIMIEKVGQTQNKKQAETIKVILSDFTASSKFSKGKYYSDRVGTAQYSAPEVMSQAYNEKCDVWAIGVITY